MKYLSQELNHFFVCAFTVLTLVITPLSAADPEPPKEWRAGEIQSKDEFDYGKFSARVYGSNCPGTISTFFLFADKGWSDEDHWQEIDFEMFGRDGAYEWQTNVIYQETPTGQNQMNELHHHTAFSIGEGWHTYTVEWSPEKIVWLIDDEEFFMYNDGAGMGIINGPLKMMFNLWTHKDGWGGFLDESQAPAFQFMDWVRYYPHTNGHAFADEPTFVEDFKNLDNWNISTHSWLENRATFDTNNVAIINDDIAVLALSFHTETGVATYAPSALDKEQPFIITSAESNKCLGVADNSSDDGAAIIQQKCDGSNFQNWTFTYAKDGLHTITNIGSEKALNVSSVSTGTELDQTPATNDKQKFKVLWDINSEHYSIYPHNGEDGTTLVVSFENTDDALTATLKENTNTSDQKFLLTPSTLQVTPSSEDETSASSEETVSSSVTSDVQGSSNEEPLSSMDTENSSDSSVEEIDSSSEGESHPTKESSTDENTAPITTQETLYSTVQYQTGKLYLNIDTRFSSSTIMYLYSIDGSLVKRHSMNEHSTTIALPNVSTGAYICVIEDTALGLSTMTAFEVH